MFVNLGMRTTKQSFVRVRADFGKSKSKARNSSLFAKPRFCELQIIQDIIDCRVLTSLKMILNHFARQSPPLLHFTSN